MKTGEKFKNLGRGACAMIMALTMCMSLIPDVTVFAAKSTEVTSETAASVSSADSTEVNTESTGNSETSDSTKSLSDTAETSTKVSTEAKSDGTSSGDTYTVTLSTADGGSLTFYEGGREITGTSKVYTSGSTVSVKLNPDDGYEVSGFAIYGTSDNEELYSGETTDDIFEFDMPDTDVTVKGIKCDK